MDTDRWCHRFGVGQRPDAEAGERVRLLGAKGAGLVAMAEMGLPVPPGFTLTTDAHARFAAHGWTGRHDAAVRSGLADLEQRTSMSLGDPAVPLLVSVRSGSSVSMPGMLSTVVGVGITADVAAGLARIGGDDFAADTVDRFQASFTAAVGPDIPLDPTAQVLAAARAVFASWNGDRATTYRDIEGIDGGLGTAVTVQAMVFGNLGDDSGSGVAVSRDPSTGRQGLTGDFLARAQGDDVVAGTHTTASLSTIESRWPVVWAELVAAADRLEAHIADMVELEFTVERGRLWLLQVRRATPSPIAAIRVAVDMAEDPAFPVDRAEAVRRCRPYLDDPPSDPAGDDATGGVVIASGLAASPGRAAGVVCLDVDRAVALAEAGTDVVLVRADTSPADVAGMAAAVAVVTTLGGLVSHAAVVARSWGLPAVVGVTDLVIVDGAVIAGDLRIEEGAVVTVDGDRGRMLVGDVAEVRSEPPELRTIRDWARETAP